MKPLFALTVAFAAALAALPALPARAEAPAAVLKQDFLDKPLTVLQEAANGRDPAMRANALEAMQPVTDPRVTDALTKGLSDQEWIVRFAAAMAIGKRKEASLQPKLLDLVRLDKNDNVKVAAVFALKRLGDDSHMNVLARTINSPDPSVRANTALVLGLLGDKSAIGLLKTRENENDVRVHLELTAALARLGDRAAITTILAQSVSLYAEDHYFAIATCADLDAPETGNVLLQGLKDNTPDGPLIAARALGKIGSNQGEQVAMDALKKDSTPAGQLALAALALGEVLQPSQAGPLLPLLDNPNPHVALASAAALLNIYSRATDTVATR